MTEPEWLTSTDPAAMLEWLRHGVGNRQPVARASDARPLASDRKLRLFACACCRQVWDQLTDKRSREAVQEAEAYAEGWRNNIDLRDVRSEAFSARYFDSPPNYPAWLAHVVTAQEISSILSAFQRADTHKLVQPHTQAALLREIIGNPYRPASVMEDYQTDDGWSVKDKRLKRWVSPAIKAFAQTIYDTRRFEDMPILADPLEDAGCEDTEILNHLRGLGPHVRGCWTIDLLLGNS